MKLSLLVLGLVLNYGRCQQENYSGALITSTNMEESIQEEAIIVTEEALTKSEFWKDRKSHIEQHFDLTYGRKWTCLIGKSSSFSAVLPEMEGMFIVFTVRDVDVILYRTEDLVTQATEKLTTAQNRVRSLESLNNKLKDEYTKNVDKLKQELEDRKRAVRRVETSLSDANKKLQSVESDAKIKTNELVQALNDKQAVTNQHSDCTSKLDMLKFQSTITQEDLTKTITKLTDEKTSLVGRVGQLDARMTQANNEQAVCITVFLVRYQK
ncbi:hypothetical protein HDE_06182 [Halotydeus destructor]|nr:hypothetical protein HDE_06182 [Halotydeus destructor]